MVDKQDWQQVNQNLVAKAIREMVFEETLSVQETQGAYTLKTPNGNYTFTASAGIWGDLRVQPESLRKEGQSVVAANYFIDTQNFTKMNSITLANFIEEMHNSLYADLKILKLNKNIQAADLVNLDGEDLQYYLSGHPKIINSKGRIGWSAAEQDLYGPENKKDIQFMWVAVKNSFVHESLQKSLQWEQIYRQSLSEEDIQIFAKKVDLNQYRLLPIHPWQWEQFIKIQFLNEMAEGILVPLSPAGDLYRPQISLRTFSNVSCPGLLDIKLPLTILNTSSFRGIPARYIEEGPELSDDFENLCNEDSYLKLANVKILKEQAGISLEQGALKTVTEAPYRYHELLGAVWRQNARSVRNTDNCLMTGALLYCDSNGGSLALEIIEKSKLPTADWVRLYAKHVILPLYHLQRKHGIGIVAHGQNIILQLRNFAPAGLILKDFQGDLRLSEDSTALKQKVPRLPAHYLIHDLITGHFITNLRYLSGILADQNKISENDFYAVIGEEILAYYQNHGLSASSPELRSLNLLAPSFHKVLINAVRYKIGYVDSSERPVPMLGSDIKNPFLNRVKHD